MTIFRKKLRYKGYEDEEEFGEDKQTTRGIRRLETHKKKDKAGKEQKKKRQKEISKPWGKGERLLVLIVLLLTVGSSAILDVSSREWKLPGLPRLKLPTFSLPFSGEEKIVIEGDKDRIRDREKAEEVVRQFKEITNKLSGVYGLYVVNLDNAFDYGTNEDETFEPASLNKLPVMLTMYKEAEEGSLSLSNKYKLKNSDKVSGSGSLSGKPAGYQLTYRDLIQYMGKESDNTAFNIAKQILGEERINSVIDEIGMRDTVIFGEDQRTTPYDIGLFFQKLWDREIISSEHGGELLEYLTDTVYEDWIAAGVPSDVKVAHKFGRELHVVNDAGVVFADEPFVLVILSKGVVEREADNIFPVLARIVFEIEVRE